MDSCENWGFWFDKLSSKIWRIQKKGEKINSAGFIDQTPAILHSSEVAVMAGMVLLKGAGEVDWLCNTLGFIQTEVGWQSPGYFSVPTWN